MEDVDILYDKLRNFSKISNQDSVSKGIVTEKIVNQLIGDIVEPFKQNTRENFDNIEFDGEVTLSPKTKRLFYEIKLGTIPHFMVSRILEKVSNLNYNRNTFFLIIADNFPQMDQDYISSLIKFKEIKNGRIAFIDYTTLIALHQFSIKLNNEYKEDKRFKLCFLQRLFAENLFISKDSFQNAFDFSKNIFPAQPSAQVVQVEVIEPRSLNQNYYEERINRLEDLALSLLEEVRKFKKELKNN
ncbi:MAG: hypothetical protein ACQCN5_03955 [Candidatus Bathyarchaeia archaeon]